MELEGRLPHALLVHRGNIEGYQCEPAVATVVRFKPSFGITCKPAIIDVLLMTQNAPWDEHILSLDPCIVAVPSMETSLMLPLV